MVEGPPLAEYESADRDHLEALGQWGSTYPPPLLAIALLLTRPQDRQSHTEDDRSPRLSIIFRQMPERSVSPSRPLKGICGQVYQITKPFVMDIRNFHSLDIEFRVSSGNISKYGLESFGEAGR